MLISARSGKIAGPALSSGVGGGDLERWPLATISPRDCASPSAPIMLINFESHYTLC